MILIIVQLLLTEAIFAQDPKFRNENNIMTARCRAQCLIKLVDDPKNDCLDMKECSSCWNLCDDLYYDSEARIGEQICQRSRCQTGCQESCRFYFTQSINIEATRTDTRFTQPLRYRTSDDDDALQFSWTCPEGNDRIEPLVYLLAAADDTRELILDQTYYQNMTVALSLLAEFEQLRLTAYDSRGKVAELEVALKDIRPVQWQIELVYMKLLDRSSNQAVEVFIDWKSNDEHVDATYEVEWRNADSSPYVTGHISTANSFIVLQLKADSKYEIVVRANGSGSGSGSGSGRGSGNGPSTVVSESSILLSTAVSAASSEQNRTCTTPFGIATKLSVGLLLMIVSYSCFVLLASVAAYKLNARLQSSRSLHERLERTEAGVVQQTTNKLALNADAASATGWNCCTAPKYEKLKQVPSDILSTLYPDAGSA